MISLPCSKSVCRSVLPPAWLVTAWLLTAWLLMPANVRAADIDGGIDFFNKRIEPVLIQHCYECHSSKSSDLEGSLRLDAKTDLLAGGDTGPAVIPGDAAASLLVKSLRYEDLEMPPAGRLPDSVIGDFERWIDSGAAIPESHVASEETKQPDYAEARKFWAFQGVRNSTPPSVQHPQSATGAIDRFILRRLEKVGLTLAEPATRRELVRRVHFNLIGLPPTPAEIDAFVNDESPMAYQRLVDRLLASPRYGERSAQHWLDVVRFAESEGFEYDRALPGAWRFRDYVIDSFNQDKPYDQFVTEQLAGDELDPGDPTLRVAAGFHRLGTVRRNAGNQEVASSRNEVLTERTDIVGVAFLGLTVGCARCHDHKFDPIPQRDYYRLQAFLAATREDNVLLASSEAKKRWDEATQLIESQIVELKDRLKQQSGEEELSTRAQIKNLEARLPPPLPTLCSIRNDPQQATPIHLLQRGNPDLPGPRVGMRALGVLVSEDVEALPPDAANPRSELADWITHSDHPLTARVIVNRIWQQHFVQGLVKTANDFGNNGARPSHPELLDFLTSRFLDNGWNLKSLHRMILLSSTFRQSSALSESKHASSQLNDASGIDPENRLLWHFPRRRLSSEEIRDAMLTAAGQLNHKMGGKSVIVPVEQELVDQLYKPSQWQVTGNPREHLRRSVYLVAKRNLRLPFMEVFDQPAAQTSCAVREQSTHAPQALELLNGRLSNDRAIALANRLRREAGEDAGKQVDLAYQLVTGRAPTTRERELSVQFIREVSLSEFALAMFNLNAFLYLD